MHNTNDITVIIPAYNEEKNISRVIRDLKKSRIIANIIVVNNCSDDNTVEIAKNEGVDVIDCMQRGKGYAMQTGLENCKTHIVLFVDGDLDFHSEDILEKMVQPIIEENCDFVKSTFDREGGRVTELVAKPLLELLFPNMYKFSQPLSGIIAGKRECFNGIIFEKDYGVDIGILLDMVKKNVKIKEVHIGKIDNCSQSWESLSKMAKEVDRAILKRADSIK